MLKLIRAYLDNCTLGTVYYKGAQIVKTVEKPWLSNQPFISCIPPGIYNLEPFDSDKHPDCFIIWNHNLGVGKYKGDSVRYGCLFHVANFPHQVEGCVGPGLELHPSTWGVKDSRKGMKKLRCLIKRLIKDNNIIQIEII